MRLLSVILLIATCMLSFSVAPVSADDKEEKKPRVYKYDFAGQDLSGKDFSKKNLNQANFEDADLSDAKFENCSLQNCNFQGAVLQRTSFAKSDLTGSDFRNSDFRASVYMATLNKVDLSGVDLNNINTNEIKMREAKLRGTKGFNQIYGTDFYMADLRGADMSTAVLLSGTIFRKAQYDQFTRWPNGFEIENKGLVLVESKPEEDAQPKLTPSKNKSDDEAAFQRLDKNEDGVLSGSEMKGLKEKDADGDGEVSLAEFLGKSK